MKPLLLSLVIVMALSVGALSAVLREPPNAHPATQGATDYEISALAKRIDRLEDATAEQQALLDQCARDVAAVAPASIVLESVAPTPPEADREDAARAAAGEVAGVPEPQSPFAAAVYATFSDVVERERLERVERERERQRQRDVDRAARVVTRLNEELALTIDAQERIAAILQKRNTAAQDIRTKRAEARESNETYDAGAANRKLSQRITSAIRNLLSPAQQARYDELIGERGVDSLGWRWNRGRGRDR